MSMRGEKKVMSKFVKVLSMDDSGIITEEIIKTEYLHKVIKREGNTGTGIRFEWYCPTRQCSQSWDFDCGTAYIRDKMFEQYERQLTGESIKTYSKERSEED